MTSRIFCALLGALLLLPACASSEPQAVLFHGGNIYSFADDEGGKVEALAIAEGEVLAAGTLAEVEAAAGANARRVDLEGSTLLPGLVDAHAHLFNLGRWLQQVQLRGTNSAQECIERAQETAATLPDGAWLKGRGWDQNDWAVEEFPGKEMLDDAFGERPVYLRRVDGHAAWVNSAALRAAGIDRDTVAPEGGEILRDPSTGEPTGIVVDNAEALVTAAIPDESAAELDRILELATADARAKGLVGVHEMGVEAEEWEALLRASAAGSLPIRIVAYLEADELEAFDGGPIRPDPSARLRLEGVKIYADGALGSRGAALIEDYSDRPGHRGLLRTPPETMSEITAEALSRDFGVAIHAIGDRGNRQALAAIVGGYTGARVSRPDLPPLKELHCRIEHAQIVHPEDIPKFHELGILPSMQPTHCTSDMPWAPQRLGDERLAGAYAWRSFLDTGTILPLGSDFPVEKVSPLLGLYAAITRQMPDGEPLGGWSPQERLTAEEAVLGFTAWAAEAIGVPEWGRLTAGSQADITLLSVDPLTASPEEILSAEIVGTVVGGEMSEGLE